MQDRCISLSFSAIMAGTFGIIGLGLAIANCWMPHDKLGLMAVPFVALAAVFWVRNGQARLASRERNAYEIGRDSVRNIR